MVSVELKITNYDQVMADLGNLGKMLRVAILKALKKSGALVKSEAIPLVRARSGKTRDSLGLKVDKKELAMYVRSRWFVGRFLEYGTVNMRARPFLRPALESNMDKIRQLFDTEINAAIVGAATLSYDLGGSDLEE